MERLNQVFSVAQRALQTLVEAQTVCLPPRELRDVRILRFVYTFEAVWKAAKRFLLEVHGLDNASPKGCMRACHEIGLLDEAETAHALGMADDRNLVVHLYNEALAVALESRLAGHTALLARWLDSMVQRVGE